MIECLLDLFMNVDYSKLWILLKEKGIKRKTDLISMADISTNILAKLNKGEYISMDSLKKICIVMDCDIGDICVINQLKDTNQKYV